MPWQQQAELAPQGVQDGRTLQAQAGATLATEIRAITPVPVISLLENVASAPPDVISWYSELYACRPVCTQAAEFGWVTRRRLWWVQGPLGSPHQQKLILPADLVLHPAGRRRPWDELQYVGKKPIPAAIHFVGGFTPAVDPKDIVANRGEGAMFPFTREFFHPSDQLAAASPEAASRFFKDHCRFPPGL